MLARTANGHFAAGNRGGPGNPHSKRTAHIKRVLLDAVSDDDLREIIKSLIEQAKGGNTKAAELVLDRLIGKPTAEPLAGAAEIELTDEEQAAVLAETKMDATSKPIGSRKARLLRILKSKGDGDDRTDGSEIVGPDRTT
jgi:uncharacterized protein with von Willebrand factor type A (vWA) domain